MGLIDKPKTWRGMKIRNIHTGSPYIVDYALMSHVQLIPAWDSEVGGIRLFWDYRNVRKHFVESDNNPPYLTASSNRS